MSSTLTGTKGVPRAEREKQILDVAVDEFAARGYRGASMVEIAERAGITKPLVYQYFGSKDGLYLACLRRVSDGLLDRLGSADDDDSVMSRLFVLQGIFEALEPQRNAWKLLYDPTMPATGDIADAARDYRARTEALATTGSESFLLARGQRDRLDASALTATWMGLVDALVEWWVEHPEESAADMTQRCYRLFTAIFG
jgi:AcrR family transcriptional regulator